MSDPGLWLDRWGEGCIEKTIEAKVSMEKKKRMGKEVLIRIDNSEILNKNQDKRVKVA